VNNFNIPVSPVGFALRHLSSETVLSTLSREKTNCYYRGPNFGDVGIGEAPSPTALSVSRHQLLQGPGTTKDLEFAPFSHHMNDDDLFSGLTQVCRLAKGEKASPQGAFRYVVVRCSELLLQLKLPPCYFLALCRRGYLYHQSCGPHTVNLALLLAARRNMFWYVVYTYLFHVC